jgi:hypothetical protein
VRKKEKDGFGRRGAGAEPCAPANRGRVQALFQPKSPFGQQHIPSAAENPTSRKECEKWGTLLSFLDSKVTSIIWGGEPQHIPGNASVLVWLPLQKDQSWTMGGT